jgi:hypothetical protein
MTFNEKMMKYHDMIYNIIIMTYHLKRVIKYHDIL